MFLDITKFKKFLSTAYKGAGLIVGMLDENLVMTNNARTWGVQVDGDHIPNKLKAALVELIGDLPEEGEVLNYTKDGAQTEMNLGEFNYYDAWMRARDYAAYTPFMLKSDYGIYSLLQLHSTMELKPIRRDFLDIISAKDIDHSVEEMPGRPAYGHETLYWKNDTTIYWAGTFRVDEFTEDIVLPRLEFLDCFEQPMKLRIVEQLPYDEED
ncbi:MAG: hypothetical protein IJO55_00335 [Lachnospiraceae bacterium]|nr:hypothetical protein [Lachnospiraceae bacterium]